MQIPGLAWDACGLLTLGASGKAIEILTVLGCPCYVVREVHEEALFLRPLPEDDPQTNTVFDLGALQTASLFHETELSEPERETFVRFAATIDDGEARTGACARHRGYWVATDDRDALRLFASLALSIPALTTLHWLHYWAEQTGASSDTIGTVLRSIRWKARYKPPRRQPKIADLVDWWEKHYPDK